MIEILKEGKQKLISIHPDSLNGGKGAHKLNDESRVDSKKLHTPLKVRSRGRPPTKRKQSKIDQIVKKAEAKSRKMVNYVLQ